MDLIYSLEQKHSVNTIDELLSIKKTIDEKLGKIENADEEIQVLQKVIAEHLTELKQQTKALSAKRNTAIPDMERQVIGLIKELGIKNGEFKVDLIYDEENFGDTGSNQIQFLFNANKEGTLQPVQQVASGGELSRLMLAVKSILVAKRKLPTIIFDEIDAGIGGEAAEAVARKIEELAGHHQVFCITHLPGIAARADAHFLVEKIADDKHSRTTIRRLTGEDRVSELARMLGGDNPTSQTRALARELAMRKEAKKGEGSPG